MSFCFFDVGGSRWIKKLGISISIMGVMLFFLFQAEDGIRDYKVTGVQTCALPILTRMSEYKRLIEIPHARSETARRYTFADGVGEIGIIAPVSHPFCGQCSRIRITSDGKIRTCLFSVWDHDLHELMRRGATDEKLKEFISGVVAKKEARHHIGEPGF